MGKFNILTCNFDLKGSKTDCSDDMDSLEDEFSDIDIQNDNVIFTQQNMYQIDLLKKCEPKELLGPLYFNIMGNAMTPMVKIIIGTLLSKKT
jgi:hypothetical protein